VTSDPTPTEQRRFVSLGTRLAVVTVAVVALATALGFVEVTRRERVAALEAKRTAATMVADLLAASLAAPLDFMDEDAIQAALSHLRDNREVAYAAARGAGKAEPVAELSRPGVAVPAWAPDDVESRTVLEPERVVAVRRVRGREGHAVGSLRLHISLAAENAAYAATRWRILGYCLALAAGTAALLIAFARRQIVRPLAQLAGSARAVERGELGGHVHLERHDEIGRLAQAMNAMSDAIFDRERRLAEAHHRLRELFDHMRQGIVVIDRDGRLIGSSSRQARHLFSPRDASLRPGSDDQELEGRPLVELLHGSERWTVEARALEQWLELAFQATPALWHEVEALAPREADLCDDRGPRGRQLRLEFRPIFDGDRVARVMLLASDETERRQLERELSAQGEAVAAMRRLVAGGGQVFVRFLETAHRRLQRAGEALAASGGQTSAADALTSIFQEVHTLRGEAMAFDLRALAEVLRSVEDVLAERRADPAVGAPLDANEAIAHGLRSAELLVAEAERAFVAASPLGAAALEQVTVDRRDVARLGELVGDADGPLAAVAARLLARPFGESVHALAEKVPRWAEGDGKRARLEIESPAARVPAPLARVLGGVLVHLVKNAIAHGIEPPAARRAAAKPEVGSVRVSAEERPGGAVEVVVADDGAGAAEGSMVARASAAGEPLAGGASRSSRAQSSDIAGRGVGLAAAVGDLAAVGYELVVSSQPGRGCRFTVRARARRGDDGRDAARAAQHPGGGR
jgi:HAMP domain-containing protein/HPt (histidine-containing phosphotransfer) domain-containing protein